MPTEITGFSPFEMLYGRKVRGPLDILKETWKAKEVTSVSVMTYVKQVQVRLKQVQQLAGVIETGKNKCVRMV